MEKLAKAISGTVREEVGRQVKMSRGNLASTLAAKAPDVEDGTSRRERQTRFTINRLLAGGQDLIREWTQSQVAIANAVGADNYVKLRELEHASGMHVFDQVVDLAKELAPGLLAAAQQSANADVEKANAYVELCSSLKERDDVSEVRISEYSIDVTFRDPEVEEEDEEINPWNASSDLAEWVGEEKGKAQNNSKYDKALGDLLKAIDNIRPFM